MSVTNVQSAYHCISNTINLKAQQNSILHEKGPDKHFPQIEIILTWTIHLKSWKVKWQKISWYTNTSIIFLELSRLGSCRALPLLLFSLTPLGGRKSSESLFSHFDCFILFSVFISHVAAPCRVSLLTYYYYQKEWKSYMKLKREHVSPASGPNERIKEWGLIHYN